jgi:hypothetical protein
VRPQILRPLAPSAGAAELARSLTIPA